MECLCIIDFVRLYDKKDVRMQTFKLKGVDDEKKNLKWKHRWSTFDIICNTVHFFMSCHVMSCHVMSCHVMNHRMQFTGPDHLSLLLNAWQSMLLLNGT